MRFALFIKAALEFMLKTGRRRDATRRHEVNPPRLRSFTLTSLRPYWRITPASRPTPRAAGLISLQERRIFATNILLRYLTGVSMESISFKLPEELLETSDRCAKALGIPRAEYIRSATSNCSLDTSTPTYSALSIPFGKLRTSFISHGADRVAPCAIRAGLEPSPATVRTCDRPAWERVDSCSPLTSIGPGSLAQRRLRLPARRIPYG